MSRTQNKQKGASVFYKGGDLDIIAKRKGYTVSYEPLDKKTKNGNSYYAFKMVGQDGSIILARNAVELVHEDGTKSFLVYKKEFIESTEPTKGAIDAAAELGISLD